VKGFGTLHPNLKERQAKGIVFQRFRFHRIYWEYGDPIFLNLKKAIGVKEEESWEMMAT
jgi:hypothetical protein